MPRAAAETRVMGRSRRASLIALLCAALTPLLTQCGRGAKGPRPVAADTSAHLKPGVTSVPTADGASVTGLTCFECHTPLADAKARVRFSHSKHAERGLHCNACHTSEDHAKPPAGQRDRHTWGVSKACVACHDGQQASDKCRTCHADTAVITPASHQRADFPRGHGKDEATLSCTYCHQRRECSNCHGLELPHPNGFARSHAAEAKAKPQTCGTCHEPNWCTTCHNGLPMPHPASFKAVHGRTDQRLCAKCHDKAFCTACHSSQNPHGSGFVARHTAAAKQNQPACGVCHQQRFCDSCHGLKMPHPANFAGQHGKEALRSGKLCAKCHEQATCNNCHGREMPHPAGFLKGHGKEALTAREDCGRCHQSRECAACHGTAMPHPSGFVYGHNGEAKFGDKASCAKCHKQTFCANCHTKDEMASGK